MEIDSNWCPSSPLQNLLCANEDWTDSNEDNIPVNPVTLTQPTTSNDVTQQPCWISLDCRRSNQLITRIRVTSGARTVEYYTGSDEVYCGSCRGAFIRTTDEQRERMGRIYRCEIDVSDSHTSFVTLKLPSLKGTDEVTLTKIDVIVANGSNVADNSSSPNGGNISHELVQEVDSMLLNAPPFVSSLLTALKSSSISENNVSDLSAMFKQVRTMDTPPEATPTVETEVVEDVNDQDINMRNYIDMKFLELKQHLDNQLQQMKQDILNEINKNWKKD